MPVRYTWDPEKNAANLRKHGVTFDVAVRIFEGFTVEQQDDRFDYEEVREIAIGIAHGSELYIVFTEVSNEERRIISARHATREERKVYWEARRRYE